MSKPALVAVNGLLFLASIAFLLVVFVLPAIAVSGWRETPCVIVRSGVQHKRNTGKNEWRIPRIYRFEIAYEYTFDGTHHSSDRYNMDPTWTDGPSGAQELAARHPVGMRATCFVNPARPSEAYLVPSFPFSFWHVLSGAFAILSGGSLYWALRHRAPLIPPPPHLQVDPRRFM